MTISPEFFGIVVFVLAVAWAALFFIYRYSPSLWLIYHKAANGLVLQSRSDPSSYVLGSGSLTVHCSKGTLDGVPLLTIVCTVKGYRLPTEFVYQGGTLIRYEHNGATHISARDDWYSLSPKDRACATRIRKLVEQALPSPAPTPKMAGLTAKLV